ENMGPAARKIGRSAYRRDASHLISCRMRQRGGSKRMGTLRTERIGGHFAGFRIDRLIGQGGMGEVYRAENPRLGTYLALKVLSPELARNEQFRERFVR